MCAIVSNTELILRTCPQEEWTDTRIGRVRDVGETIVKKHSLRVYNWLCDRALHPQLKAEPAAHKS